jgi:hypothetical protein
MGHLNSQSPADLAFLALLVTGFVVMVGAMLTPPFLALTRPIHPVCQRLARQAAWSACKNALVRFVAWIAAVLTAGAALVVVIAVISAPAIAKSARDGAPHAMSHSIERMVVILDKAAKYPVAQIAGLVARGHTAVKVYRLSQEMKVVKTDVVALQASVHAILVEITSVILRVEQGEVLTAEQIAALNARLDVHSVRIAAAEAEVEVIKVRMSKLERTQRDTAAVVAGQTKRIARPAKRAFEHYDPKCDCRRDIRDRDRTVDMQVTKARGH